MVFPLAHFGSRSGPSPEAGLGGDGGSEAGERGSSPAPFPGCMRQSPEVQAPRAIHQETEFCAGVLCVRRRGLDLK